MMNRATITQLLELFKSKKLKPSDYALRVISQFKKFKDLNYYVYLNEDDLLKQAYESDNRYIKGTNKLLEGIPISLKDNIFVKDHPCTACTPSLAQFKPLNTAVVVQSLFDQGCILTGRCNMDELALGVTTINEFTGNSLNFFNKNYSCGGSSGGSAGAVAADIVPIALGTDTTGSIRIPSAFCGVFGYKPTIGRWNCNFGIKLTDLRDSIGPICRSAEDIAYLDRVVTQQNYGCVQQPNRFRIGVFRTHYWQKLDQDIEKQSNRFINFLKQAGFDVIETDGFEIQQHLALSPTMIQHELLQKLKDFIQNSNLGISFDQFINQIKSKKIRQMLKRYLNNTISISVFDILQKRQQIQSLFTQYVKQFDLDCWIYPTTKITAQPLSIQDYRSFYHQGEWWNFLQLVTSNIDSSSICNHPCITLPIGQSIKNNTPIGISLEALVGSDYKLIQIARSIEKHVLLKEN